MKGSFWINFVRVLLILFALIMICAFLGLRTLTMVNPWIVVLASAVVAFPIAMVCAIKGGEIIPLKSRLLRVAVWLVLLTPTLTGAFYGINFLGTNNNGGKEMPAVVERKYYEERDRTRRVGRGRYVPTGEKYKVYYGDIRLEDGHKITVPLTRNAVRRVQDGQTLNVHIAKGTFGIPVVITKDIFKNIAK